MKRVKRVLIAMIVLTVFFGTNNLGVFAATADTALKANNNTGVEPAVDYVDGAYFLSFDLNGATGTAPEEQMVITGSFAVAVEDPTREGYDFIGWNTMADGSGEAWDFATTAMPGEDVILYAQWKEAEVVIPEEKPDPEVVTPEEKPVTEEKKVVQTGDESNLMAAWGMLVIAGTVLVIGRKKKNI